MLSFLTTVALWVILTVGYVLNPRRNVKWLAGLFVFPLAFTLLAVAQWLLQWHMIHREMEISGPSDAMLHIQNVLLVTRSALLIAAAGGVSLAVTAAMFLLPCGGLRGKLVHEDGIEPPTNPV